MQEMVVDDDTREYMEQNIEFIDWWGDQLSISAKKWWPGKGGVLFGKGIFWSFVTFPDPPE